jgi:hypothetical protein
MRPWRRSPQLHICICGGLARRYEEIHHERAWFRAIAGGDSNCAGLGAGHPATTSHVLSMRTKVGHSANASGRTRVKNICLVLATVFLAAIVPALNAQGSSPISLKIALVGDSPKIGSEILLRVTLTNVTQHKITLASGWPEQQYKVDLRDDSGKPVPTREYYQFGTLSYVDSAPGGSREDDLELSHMYQLTRPGTYVVQVTRKSAHEPGVRTENSKSNELVINIAPRNATTNNGGWPTYETPGFLKLVCNT